MTTTVRISPTTAAFVIKHLLEDNKEQYLRDDRAMTKAVTVIVATGMVNMIAESITYAISIGYPGHEFGGFIVSAVRKARAEKELICTQDDIADMLDRCGASQNGAAEALKNAEGEFSKLIKSEALVEQ